jgi:apolipoprotein N-acyltransferase
MPTRNWSCSLAALSGLLLIFSQPPVSLFFVAYAALVPLFFSLKRNQNGHNFLMGMAMGFVGYVGLLYWVVVAMYTYGGLGIPFSLLTLVLLVLYVSIYVGVFALIVPLLRDRFHVPIALSAPPLWVLLEYVRGFLLSGFPWSFLAHSQYNFLPLIQAVSLTGTYFISFLIVAANCLVYEVLSRRHFPYLYGSLVVALFAGCLLFGIVRLRQPMEATIPTSIVQGNIHQDVKFDNAYKNSIVETYRRLSLEQGGKASLIVWPETAMPFVFLSDQSQAKVRTVPMILSNHLLFGTIFRDRQRKYYNAAYVIGKNGEIEGAYSKVHLVPFGEYTPLTSYFPFLERISVAAGDFFSGPSHAPMASGVGKIGMLICYEGVFPGITNETVRDGAQVLVNITNDAWFGPTSAPYQHLAFYVFRAAETDRYVLRAANTGISAIIDPRGRTVARTKIFREAVLNGSFALRSTLTPYVRYGDYFVLLSILFLCAVVALSGLSSRSTSRND